MPPYILLTVPEFTFTFVFSTLPPYADPPYIFVMVAPLQLIFAFVT